MTETVETRTCKSCQRILPVGYKHKYCEACRNQKASVVKKVLGGIGAAVVTAGTIAVAIITNGKKNT